MNPSSKRGFHVLLVLFKVLPSLLLRILGLGRNPNKTLDFWEQTNNYAIVWKTIPSFKSSCSSIPLILACLISFLSLPLPLLLLSFSLLSLSIRFGLSKMRDQFCHVPDPGPTRLVNPNRFRGAKPYAGTPYLFIYLFFKAELISVV